MNERHSLKERFSGRKLESPSTVGIEIGTVTLDKEHQVQTWDLGGQEVSVREHCEHARRMAMKENAIACLQSIIG